MKQNQSSPNSARARKKSYQAPSLAYFGRLSELTQATGSGNPEQNCGNARDQGSGRNCSERHTKQNIERVGTHPLGFGLYRFEYREAYRDQWGHGRQFGVIVDEVEPIVPEAISMHPDGYKLVDYAMLGIDPQLH